MTRMHGQFAQSDESRQSSFRLDGREKFAVLMSAIAVCAPGISRQDAELEAFVLFRQLRRRELGIDR